jgi:hypothetical protein
MEQWWNDDQQRKTEEAWRKPFCSGSSSTTNLNSSLLLILWAKFKRCPCRTFAKRRIFVKHPWEIKGVSKPSIRPTLRVFNLAVGE